MFSVYLVYAVTLPIITVMRPNFSSLVIWLWYEYTLVMILRIVIKS